jgi:NhaP-type Na+/H+ or K+/H+ antiporter
MIIMTRNNGLKIAESFSIDTTFVLFFLALELGRTTNFLAIDTLLLSITMLMVLVLPYFLPSEREQPSFGTWIGVRGAIAAFGIMLGLAFQKSIGHLAPETLKLVPMTGLIIAAMISSYVQFYSLLKLRLAK